MVGRIRRLLDLNRLFNEEKSSKLKIPEKIKVDIRKELAKMRSDMEKGL